MLTLSQIYAIGLLTTFIFVCAFAIFSPNLSPEYRSQDDFEALTGCVIHILIIVLWPIALPLIAFFVIKNKLTKSKN